jgi:hypothetical protein
MFRIGNIRSKKFAIRVSPPPFAERPYDYSQKFFLCHVMRLGKNGMNFMVDLHKDEDFPSISFRFPPKSKGELSIEEAIYAAEWNHWNGIKDNYDPMLYLHRSSIEKIISRCFELSSFAAPAKELP